MAVLTAKARKHVKNFGLPGKDGKPGKYPMPDREHAADAKGRVTQQLAKGNITPEQAAKVRHDADQVLGKGDARHHMYHGK